jgi:hypothetical protein
VTAAPFVSEKKIIGLNVLGGWNLPSLSLKINLSPKKYHFSIIAEQFKIGPEFLEEFATLSNKFKFIFIWKIKSLKIYLKFKILNSKFYNVGFFTSSL